MARSAEILIDVRTAEARAELTRLEGGLEEVDIAAVEAGDGFERFSTNASQELSETRAQAERTATSMNQLSSSTAGTANQFSFELVQASQDAAFGIENVANQAPLLAEQFTRLQSQAGGTTGALSALASSLTNPVTGTIAAITLLLTFKDEIIGFFESWTSGAEDAKEASKELKKETRSTTQQIFETLRGDEELQQRALSTLQEASETARQEYINALGTSTEEAEKARQEWRNIESAIEAIKNVSPDVEENFIALTELGLSADVAQPIAEMAADTEDSADAAERQAQALSDQVQSLQRIQRVQAAGPQPAQANPGAGPGGSPGPNFTSFELVGSARELGRELENVEDQSKSAFTAAQLGSQLATSSVNALTQSLRQGQSAAEGLQRTFSQLLSQVGSTLLQTAITGGSALGITAAGPLAALGIGGGLLGGLVGSFDEGGEMGRAGMAQVHPPEFIMAGGGTQIVGQEETEQILQSAGGGMRREMARLTGAVEQMMSNPRPIKLDPYAVQSELSTIQSEQAAFSA